MALDRRITLAIQSAGHRNDFDEFIPGAIVNYPVWAEYRPQDLERIATTGGILVVTYANWRVRYFGTLIEAAEDLTRINVIDEFGESFTTRNIYEDTGRNGQSRRRFIVIEGVHA